MSLGPLHNQQSGVAPDGSPVDVYLSLPVGDTPTTIHQAILEDSTILELGSGPGRITRPLVELGHQVVAVDESPEMLAHIGDAETHLGDVFDLNLGRTFDAVIAGGNLINTRERGKRDSLLTVCRRHVKADGVVLLERYDPLWAAAPTASRRILGAVEIEFEPLVVEATWFRGRVTYSLADGRTWNQEFTATNVTDEMLAEEAANVGLNLVRWLDHHRTWARLAPQATDMPT